MNAVNGSGCARGYLFNIIIYTHEKHRAEYFHQMVKAFIQQYPCRAIFISGTEDTQIDRLESESLEGPCEQLLIEVSKSRLHLVPFLVLPQLISDLPIYLVWGQNPTSDNELLPQLQKIATRFIYDADCAKNLQDFGQVMLKKIHKLHMEFMDVGWAQIAGWRDVITQVFDTKEKLKLLKNSHKILIKYNALPNAPIKRPIIPSVYFQCWLAAQLGWKPVSKRVEVKKSEGLGLESVGSESVGRESVGLEGVGSEGVGSESVSTKSVGINSEEVNNEGYSTIVTYDNMGSPLEIEIQHQERPSIRQGRLFEIEFSLPDNQTYTLSLQDKQSKVLVFISTAETCQIPISIGIKDTHKGLTAMKEIFYYQVSDHYTHMLKVLTEINWEV